VEKKEKVTTSKPEELPAEGLMLRPYRGYHGVVHRLDLEANLFAGRVQGLHRDMVTFYGATPLALQAAFEASLDSYLQGCNADGVRPELPAPIHGEPPHDA
jgi:predicted HicB family RNase H-like nuclease